MPADDPLLHATFLSDLGRYDESDPLLAEVLAGEPDSEPAMALLVRGLVARGRFADAAAEAKRLLARHPDSLRGLIGLARIEGLLGRAWDGVPYARRAVALYPDDEICLVVLADVLNRARPGAAEAMRLLDRALAIDPHDATACRLYGTVHLDVAQYEDAERWTLRALQIAPADASTILQLGLARAGLGRFDESREQVMAALRADAGPSTTRQVVEHIEAAGIPEHLAELYRLALSALGRPDLSVPGAAGRDAELLAEQAALARRMYSRYATPAGVRRAAELADAVLAVDPRNQPARYVRARTLGEAERFAEALPLAEALCREGFPAGRDALMVAQAGLGDHVAALETLREILLEQPDSPRHLVAQSMCLRHLERFDEALAAVARAAELSPAEPGVQLERGIAARAAGDLPQADAALGAALRQSPENKEAMAWRALVWAETDRWAEAAPLVAVVCADEADPRSLVLPVTELANFCLMAAVPALEADEPRLDEGTRWLHRSLDLYEAAERGGRPGEADFFSMWSPARGVLHTIAAPDDSGFAGFLRRLDATMLRWRGEPGQHREQ
jgi:tetratricopeptide (TPR) repeat protein